ncbi:MAG: hypothetical protein AABY74_04710, partial [Planctomycetota bacterium]
TKHSQLLWQELSVFVNGKYRKQPTNRPGRQKRQVFCSNASSIRHAENEKTMYNEGRLIELSKVSLKFLLNMADKTKNTCNYHRFSFTITLNEKVISYHLIGIKL